LQARQRNQKVQKRGYGVSLQYDFDIVRSDKPLALDAQPQATFRDADTRAAVLTLPRPARQWLQGAGFLLDAQPTTLAHGEYAAADEAARLHIMQRLHASLKDHDLAKAGKDTFSTFVIADFIDAMAKATPVDAEAVMPDTPQIPGPFAGLRGRAAKEALAKAAPRGWRPKPAAIPFGMLALARRQGFLKLTLGTAFVYCAVLLYLYR
jgi:hypothetical protein